MSAIYGIINLDGKQINTESFMAMEKEYSDFKIDIFDSVSIKNAAFGTGLIYITKQSRSEQLPYFDPIHNTLFTTDCYLDNKSELIPQLKETGLTINLDINNDTPDGMLIYLSYLKWGSSLCDHLLGVFAIAIYEFGRNKFHLYVDHCGDRCVHYYLKDNSIYFSTLIRPIQAATGYSIDISEQYIAACESNLSPDMVLYPGMTPYEGIYQLLASQHLEADCHSSNTSLSISQYWDPINTVKPLKLSNDDEYKKLFLDTYTKCITDTMSVDGNIGCFLSSGLDSTSVASIAAIHLNAENKDLHSYTSVPITEFLNGNSHRLEDESKPVQKFCDHFGNIKPKYIRCDGKSALTELKHFVNLFNSPVKYAVNAVWMEEIYKTASVDGCKLLLKGQHGNSSVSHGGLISRIWTELKSFHFISAINQYKTFSKSMYINKKAFLNAFLSEFIDQIHPSINLDMSLTRKDLLKKYKIKHVYIKRAKYYGGENIYSKLQRKRSIFMPASFQQVSYTNAHFELMSGLIARDPTRDKRIIELCLAFPERCFSDGKYERRLITYYMKDIIPKHIIHQMYNRGIQSPEYIKRIVEFSKDKNIYVKCLADGRLSKYIENERLKNLCFNPDDNYNVLSSLNSLSLYYFLSQKKQEL